MKQPETLPNAPDADPPGEPPALTLVATNNSTVPGKQCFNIFPPPMTVSPEVPQTPVPLVSSVTVTGDPNMSVATLTWPRSSKALSFIVLQSGQDPAAAARTSVTLGSTLTVTWQNDAFVVTSVPGEGSAIIVTFDPSVPATSVAGLVVGPGPILVPVPVGGGTLTLTPNLTQIVTARFGTLKSSDPSGFSDLSQPVQVIFHGNEAAITIGPDNLIVQTA